jgi:hypothetical protein
MLTEVDARTKWCPMTRTSTYRDGEIGPCNRVDAAHGEVTRQEIFDTTRCIASECMMWRWERTDGDFAIATRGSTHGYCGLAGRQEIVA